MRTRVDVLISILVVFICVVADHASADELSLQPSAGRALSTLYEQVAARDLDLKPFYESIGVRVSDNACMPDAPSGDPRSCRRGICPMAKKLDLQIYCLYRSDTEIERGDLLVEGPPPVRALSDYDSAWNVFQFEIMEKKVGALRTLGLVRSLAIPGYERSGFFEWKIINETRDGGAQVAKWKNLASADLPSCSTALCFSINRLKMADELGKSSPLYVLAECVRRMVGGVQGAPQYCVPVYLDGPKGAYVAALTSFRNETMSVTAGVITAKIFFPSKLDSGKAEVISELVERAFAAPPLSFTTSRDPDAIVGVGGKRRSVVLANWHEQATVRAVMSELPLSVRDPGQGIQNFAGVQVGFATTLYVNNRNTMDDSEWRMPSPDQNQAFDGAVVSTVRSLAYQICPEASSQARNGILIITCPSRKW